MSNAWGKASFRGLCVLTATATLAACSSPPMEGDVTADYVETVVPTARDTAFARGKNRALDSFAVRVVTTDPFGNEAQAPAVTFAWSESDLNRVNWSSIDAYQLLDLATLRIDHSNGVIALHDWCNADGLTLTRRLCTEARNIAENDWAARQAPPS